MKDSQLFALMAVISNTGVLVVNQGETGLWVMNILCIILYLTECRKERK